jgi:cobalt-precorrin-5B (C1)-methyltransferase
LEVTISVPAGEELAKKTLNHRLGILGGISILGTTGIVRPISAEAWTATITASMDVAKAAGLDAVVISSGRTSEKAHMKKYHFPDEAYAMMGDYVEFALKDAKRHGFREAHLCAQWAKMVKTAMGTPQTHVRHGALEAEGAAEFLIRLGIYIPRGKAFNTTREIFDYIYSAIPDPQSAMTAVCTAAKRYAEGITSGVPVIAHLVSYEGDILAQSE